MRNASGLTATASTPTPSLKAFALLKPASSNQYELYPNTNCTPVTCWQMYNNMTIMVRRRSWPLCSSQLRRRNKRPFHRDPPEQIGPSRLLFEAGFKLDRLLDDGQMQIQIVAGVTEKSLQRLSGLLHFALLDQDPRGLGCEGYQNQHDHAKTHWTAIGMR